MSFWDILISKEKQLANAINNRNIEKAKQLIEQGANVNAIVWESGSRIINEAIRYGNLEFVKLLCEKGADVNPEYKGWFSPLKDAIRNKKLNIVKYLIEKGANINDKDKGGKTALMDSCQDGNLEIVKHLIEKGADINIKDNNGKTAYEITVEKARSCSDKKYWEIAKLFEDTKQVSKILGAGDILNISRGIKDTKPANKSKSEISVETKSKEKDETISSLNEQLMKACCGGKLEVVQDLIEKGADINAKNKYGQTPLLFASLMMELEIIKLLINRGADVNAANSDGQTALYLLETSIEQESGGDSELKEIMEQDSFEILDYLRKHSGKQNQFKR